MHLIQQKHVVIFSFYISQLLGSGFCVSAQNSMVGDGYGGREWYVPHNYQVGAYSGFTVCGLDSQLYAWGGNVYGELGNGTTISTTTPVAVPGMNHVKFYTTGYISAVIKNDNTVWAWGDPTYFSLPFANTPTQIFSDAKFIDAGMTNIVCVKNDGTVWTAGLNNFGEFGTGATSFPSAVPIQMPGISNAVRAIAAGCGGSISTRPAIIILLADGTVKITAGDDRFQPVNTLVPITVSGLTDIVDIKAGTSGAYALDNNGNVFSFGRESFTGNITAFKGLLGHGDNTGVGYVPPTQLIFPAGAKPIVALSANVDGFFCLALDSSHRVYAWGDNRLGAVGNGDPLYQNPLTPELVAENVVDIGAGETFSYIIKGDNSLWATGASGYNNTYGSIWMNLPNVQRNVFTQIDPLAPPMGLCAPAPFGVVPIRLISFDCVANGEVSYLTWVSGEELNFNRFEVEHSTDGKNFSLVSNIHPKGSNSKYNFTHIQNSNIAFYRLRLIDNDGKFKYSETRMLNFSKISAVDIYPNPFTNSFSIIYKNDLSIRRIEVLDISGNVLKIINHINPGQKISLVSLPIGTYFLKIISTNKVIEYKKLIRI